MIVGGRSNARVATKDGEGFETTGPTGVGGLNAVSVIDPSWALVGGVSGFVGRFDVASGEVELEESLPGGDVHAFWSDGEGRTVAVGGRFSEPLQGLAWVRTEDPQ